MERQLQTFRQMKTAIDCHGRRSLLRTHRQTHGRLTGGVAGANASGDARDPPS